MERFKGVSSIGGYISVERFKGASSSGGYIQWRGLREQVAVVGIFSGEV